MTLEEMEALPLLKFEGVCSSEGCQNEGLPIELLTRDPEPTAWCGPCGTKITSLHQIFPNRKD